MKKNVMSIRYAKEYMDEQRKALELAQARLKAEGRDYPMYNANLPLDENLRALEAYRVLEANYMLEALRMPSGDRPLEIDNVKPQKKERAWGRPYYDD